MGYNVQAIVIEKWMDLRLDRSFLACLNSVIVSCNRENQLPIGYFFEVTPILSQVRTGIEKHHLNF